VADSTAGTALQHTYAQADNRLVDEGPRALGAWPGGAASRSSIPIHGGGILNEANRGKVTAAAGWKRVPHGHVAGPGPGLSGPP